MREALEGLPWVDHKSAKVDLAGEMVLFQVTDMKQFDEAKLLEAFRKANFPKTKVLRKPKK